MFAVGDKVRCVDSRQSDLETGWIYVVSGVTDHRAGVRIAGKDQDRFYVNGRFVLAHPCQAPLPESKREAAEQHAVAGIGPTAEKTDAQVRKGQPVARGVLDYFPDALFAVAEISRIGNEQHNPGQPMHWAYGKSMDHRDCCIRHLADSGELDSDGALHDAKAAWRALANLQTLMERRDPELHARRQAQRDASAKGER